MGLDAKTEKVITEIVAEARQAFGADLVTLALYGSGAGEDFTPGRSDLNLVIVVDRVRFEHVQALQRHLQRWRKRGVATPLLLDRHFLERGRDVFPMEFLDIKIQHRVLHGEDVFATLPIDSRHLRYESEHEARGKLLRLRAVYAEIGGDRKGVEALMLDSVKTFLIIMRNFVRLHGGPEHTRYLEVLGAFETDFGVSFPTTRHVLRVKLGLDRWSGPTDDTFAAYLQEVEQLVETVDRLTPEGEAETH